MKRRPWARATIAPAALLGAVLGVLILHPVADAISWFDLRRTLRPGPVAWGDS